MDITKGRREYWPRRLGIHGKYKEGKSTTAAAAPNPLFIALEDGQSHIGVDRIECWKKSWTDVLGLIHQIASPEEKHDYKTLVIDTATVLQAKMEAEVVSDANDKKVKTIQDIGYGKGPPRLAEKFDKVLQALDDVVNIKKMSVIVICQTVIETITPADGTPYDQFTLDLEKKNVRPRLCRWLDDIMFVKQGVLVADGEDGKAGRAKKFKGRMAILKDDPSCECGVRLPSSSPSIIELNDEGDGAKYWEMIRSFHMAKETA